MLGELRQEQEFREEEEAMLTNMIKEMPFHSVVASGEGMISERQMEGLLQILNGHFVKGIKMLLWNPKERSS